jgi:phytol kinase
MASAHPAVYIIILNYVSYKKDIFSGMERERKDASSLGTVWYAVSMTVLAALSVLDSRFLPAYGIGFFCMAFGDGLAPMFGGLKKGNFYIIKGKRSFYGSLSVFVASVIVCAIMTAVFTLPLTWYEIGAVGLAGAALEIAGLRGLDNLTVPIGTAVISWLFII